MPYRKYNANPRNNSVTDCFIRSLAVVTDESWDYTYNKISDIAQWEGTTMDNRDFILEYLDRRYKRVPFVEEYIGEFAENHPRGKYLITTKGHIVACVDGYIIDSWDSRYRKIEYVWKIGQKSS